MQIPEPASSAAGRQPPCVRMTREASGIITSVDDSIVDLLGWRPDQIVGAPSTNLIHPEDQSRAISAWFAMLSSGAPNTWTGRYLRADGTWMWVEVENTPGETETSPVLTQLSAVEGERLTAEAERHAREQVLSRLSDAIPVGVFQMDMEGRLSFVNDRLHTIMGAPAAATVEAQMASVVPSDRPAVDAAIAGVFANQPIDDLEFQVATVPGGGLPGEERTCSLSLRPLTDLNDVVCGAVGCVSDVTERALARRQLELKASVDTLTSCLNRESILTLLRQVAADPATAGEGVALLFLDLDDFKAINDRHGHAAGDRLLAATGERLAQAVRGRDHIGRLGGDEFLVICPGVESERQAVLIAERIASALAAPVEVAGQVVEPTVSTGIAWTSGSVDVELLIAHADEAMYASKRCGKGGVSLFRSERPAPAPR
jgi:diguanylate cyclase (GGDEF)-like protein/PAS domain S-box-containing protein